MASQIPADFIARFTGRIAAELVHQERFSDNMFDLHNLDDAEDSKIYRTLTGTPTEVAIGTDRISGAGTTDDDPITLTHNKPIEVTERVQWEDQLKLPFNLLERKIPTLAAKMLLARNRRLVAYGVTHTSNYDAGPSTPDNVIDDDFTTSNSTLNRTIIDALLATRNLFVAQESPPTPETTFCGVNSTVFARCFTIQEIKGREFTMEVGNQRFQAFTYADMTVIELPMGLGESITNGNFGITTANTPSKFIGDLSDYAALAWQNHNFAVGYAYGGLGEAAAAARQQRVGVTIWGEPRYKTMYVNAAMVMDASYVYENADGDESPLFVTWLQT